jgi:NADH-quinone oxidoreductase subunit H
MGIVLNTYSKAIFIFKNEHYFGYLDFILYSIMALVPLLIAIAFFTLAERKAMAAIQRRKGANVVGFWGFLQPFADGLKLVVKEIIIPNKANRFLFIFGSSLTLFLSLIGWVVVPFNVLNPLVTINTSLLLVLVVSSLGVYGILLAGWSSNSKYALLGSLRSVSQMISYEVSISLIVIPVILLSGSLSLSTVVNSQVLTVWFIYPLFPLGAIFFVSTLAETNRIPFDLPEAEAELVAGYNVEYSAFTFASFFLGEYSNILMMSTLFVLFFLGGGDYVIPFSVKTGWNYHECLVNLGYDLFLGLKVVCIAFVFVFIRANLPRFRFDQLMFIGWKVFLPITLGFVFFYTCFFLVLECLEITQLPRIRSGFHYVNTVSIRF